MIESGASFEEMEEAIHRNKLNATCMFVPGSIGHLKRGGRITPTKALLAKVMSITPIIKTNEEGKLVIASLHVGRKKTLINFANHIKETISEKVRKIYLMHTNNMEELHYFVTLIKERIFNVDIETSCIDNTMGCHCGPRTLAAFYILK
jgi:DegV family protein with EDD domain